MWRAVVRRLLTFLNHINEVEEHAATENKFSYTMQSENIISLRHVTICTPQGETLLLNINETFVHGNNYLIKGVSGIGKSTFVRVIARIWPYGSGEIDLPDNKKIMYVPQKSYMPIGTLLQALLFPNSISHLPESDVIQALNDCDLPDLVHRLHDVAMWSEQLSPGELQRVAFVRVLLHKPDWVFLDESTSALDLPHERQLYSLLKAKLPQCSIVSVGHQPSVEVFHEYQIDFSKYKVERELVV
jgi:putative ATP-binding cassette transporter